MIGQIQLLECSFERVQRVVAEQREQLIQRANLGCQNMLKRGGGVSEIRARRLCEGGAVEGGVDEMVVIDVLIDVCESMGANIVNTVLESVSPFLEELTGARCGIRILSNLCTERMVRSQFEIPVEKMRWKAADGRVVAQRILESYRFAQLDPYRATTHNKGIMNGIDAVAVALGQDWRSVEASCHAFAQHRTGRYQPLSHYEIARDARGVEVFRGALEIPVSVGAKGGVLESNQIYQQNMQILGFPGAQGIAQLMATVGLAQNFAALRALSIEGIQKGHMSLHARNIAVTAGVPTHLVEDCVRFMRKRSRISVDCAKEYVRAYDIHCELRTQDAQQQISNRVLSTFYIELTPPRLDDPIKLHVAFDCGPDTQHIVVDKDEQLTELHHRIFGSKGYDWMNQIFSVLDTVRLDTLEKHPDQNLPYKLKLMTILIDLIIDNLMRLDSRKTTQAVRAIEAGKPLGAAALRQEPIELRYGLSLVAELFSVFSYNLQSHNLELNRRLRQELLRIMNSSIEAYNLSAQSRANKFWHFDQFLAVRQKRLCATMMLLCDSLNLKVHRDNDNAYANDDERVRRSARKDNFSENDKERDAKN